MRNDDGSGDRSLLRAPTDAAIDAAFARLESEDGCDLSEVLGRECMREILGAAYAVDGLRGTEDRELREQLEALAEAAQNYLLAEQYIGVSEEQMRALNHRLGSLAGPHLKAKCARESVEGEQRGTHGGD